MNLLKLRPVQEEALDAIIESFKGGGTYHLVQAPVAFGKTILSSGLMDRSFSKYGAKCLFLAHLRELVTQTIDKVSVAAPALSCGVFMGSQREIKDITIGTRQTVERNLEAFGPINLLICDECHLWSPQYQKIADYFLKLNPRLRVLGVTGTPFSKKGWIYGEGKVWPDPCYTTTIDKMISLGYLSPFRYKLAESEEIKRDLAGVKIVGNEFHEGDLGMVMEQDLHLGSVSKAIEEHCQGRKKIMVFGVTIEHAEKLASHLGAKAVHSKLKKKIWRERVDDFKHGDERILVNVSQLSVGFDSPEVDALVIARPTCSPALHVQICGRALRVCPGKDDAMIIDLCGNYVRNGLPNKPKIYEKEKRSEGGEREARAQVCPDCLEVVEGPDVECPFCGAEMKDKIEINEINEQQRMREIEAELARPQMEIWGSKPHVTGNGNVGTLFWVRLKGRKKPLFRFCGDGTKKEERTRAQLKGIDPWQRVDLMQTAYGEWIA